MLYLLSPFTQLFVPSDDAWIEHMHYVTSHWNNTLAQWLQQHGQPLSIVDTLSDPHLNVTTLIDLLPQLWSAASKEETDLWLSVLGYYALPGGRNSSSFPSISFPRTYLNNTKLVYKQPPQRLEVINENANYTELIDQDIDKYENVTIRVVFPSGVTGTAAPTAAPAPYTYPPATTGQSLLISICAVVSSCCS